MRSWLDLPIPLSSSEPTISSSTDERSKPSKSLKGKQILFVSSISGLVAMTPQFQAAYNASKAGVTMLAKVCPVGLDHAVACAYAGCVWIDIEFGSRVGTLRSDSQFRLTCTFPLFRFWCNTSKIVVLK